MGRERRSDAGRGRSSDRRAPLDVSVESVPSGPAVIDGLAIVGTDLGKLVAYGGSAAGTLGTVELDRTVSESDFGSNEDPAAAEVNRRGIDRQSSLVYSAGRA